MGVTGLIGAVDNAGVLKKVSLGSLTSTNNESNNNNINTAAIDTYCLLHRGAFACGTTLATGGTSDLYIKYCLKYVNMLLSYSIKPILVFDGRHLPAKAKTEKKRRETRDLAKQRAAELLRIGKTEEARSQLRRCVDITHEMAFELIKECRKRNVDCIVAPYEADAQLAYLNKIKLADIVITEDSDLILFGCSKILFKLDLNGNGVLFDSTRLYSVMKCPLEKYSFKKFRRMCILSGCDYLASLPGIGLAKARNFMNATQDPDIRNALKKIPSFLNKNQLVVTEEYQDGFMMAEATFMHQLVYDPLQRKIVPLIDPKEEGTKPDYLCNAGDMIEDDIAFDLALGNLDPFTLKRYDSWRPNKNNIMQLNDKVKSWNKDIIAPHKSIWSEDYLEYVNKKQSDRKQKIASNNTAISNKPTTKNIVVKVSCPEIKEEGLTIEDLTAMYVVNEKPKKTFVPETQDFEDTELIDFANNSRPMKRSLSPPEKENDQSPILENKNRSYKKLMKNDSFTRLSKISKFKRTVIDESTVVESRFFSPKESIEENSESGLNISGISTLNMEDESPATDLKENLFNLDVFDDKSSIANDNLITNRRLTSNFNWSSHSDTLANKVPKENAEDKVRNPFKKQSLEAMVDSGFGSSQEIIEISEVSRPSIQEVIQINEQKSAQFCRRPGLTKKKSSSTLPGQKLLTTFGFQKKSQLKR